MKKEKHIFAGEFNGISVCDIYEIIFSPENLEAENKSLFKEG